MDKHCLFRSVLGIIMLLCVSQSTEAKIISLVGGQTSQSTHWIFDHELQHLTLIGDIYLLQPGDDVDIPPPVSPRDSVNLYSEADFDYDVPRLVFGGGSIHGLGGTADSDSFFHFTGLFNNKTGITWTGFRVAWGAPYIWGNIPFKDVVFLNSSKFSVSDRDVPPSPFRIILLSGPPAVLPNEVFTINLDVYVGQGRFYDDLRMGPIPEPATVVLLALGSIGLVRRRRTESSPEV